MNLGAANGKIFLLYEETEESHIRKIRKQLVAAGIIAIPCNDPENFRFVTPEVIRADPATLDVIGRLALRHLGDYNAKDKFVADLRKHFEPQETMEGPKQ